MGWTVVILAMLSGCFSWAQQDPPPRTVWNEPLEHRCDGRGAALAALIGAGVMAGASVLIVEETRDDDFAVEERSWLLLTVPLAIGWTFDALNAFADGGECQRYRQHRRGA